MGKIKIQAANISKTISKEYTSVAKTIIEEAEHLVKEATVEKIELNSNAAINLHSEAGIKHEDYSPVDPEPVYEEITEISLTSTFALEQLQKMAKKDSRYSFIYHIKKTYGKYFSNAAIEKLYNDAKNGAVANPEIKVVRFISPPNAGGAYHNDSQEILISHRLIDQALEDNDKMGELMVVLIEEFGAHVNWLLRNTYTAEADKPKLKPRKSIHNDYGAKFASFVLNINFLDTQNQTFAQLTDTITQYENDEETGTTTTEQELIWDYQDIHVQLNEYVDQGRQNKSDIAGNYNFYKAGRIEGDDKYGHLDIEEKALTEVLKKVFLIKNDTEIKEIIHKIYLGNWLRDYSQVIDPGMVRPLSDKIIQKSKNGTVSCTPLPTKEEQENCEKDNLEKVNDPVDVEVPKDYQILGSDPELLRPSTWVEPKIIYEDVSMRPVTWSRETLTSLVKLLAVQEFMHTKEDGALTKDNYEDLLTHFEEEYIEITPKLLGVYRPEEHIDNPKSKESKAEAPYLNYNTENPDADFVESPDDMGFVGDPYTKDPKNLELGINKTYGMKNYIRTDLDATKYSTKRTAYDYVVYKIEQACVQNPNFDKIEPMIHFGAALHVLEDYFAHSNFSEISAAKVSNNDRVFPWVDKVPHKGDSSFNYDVFAKKDPKAAQVYLDKENTGSVIRRSEMKFDPSVIKKNDYNHIARFIPLVTGTFGKLDMMASLLPILEKHFSIKIEDYSRIDSGERTFKDVLAREILKDMDEAQDVDGSGTKDNTYTKRFENLLSLRDSYADAKKIIPSRLRESFHTLMEYVGAMLNFSFYMMLRAFGANIKDAQLVLQEQLLEAEKNGGVISIGTDPSHTQIAKDEPGKPMHKLSAKLAVYVVRYMGTKMFKFWKGDPSVSKQDILDAVDTLFHHPAASSWQDKMVKEWCDSNSSLLCQASTPSVIIDTIITSIEEMNEFTGNLIKTSKDDKKETSLIESILDTYDKDGQLIGLYNKLLQDGKALLEKAIEIRENSNYSKYYRPYHCPQPQKKEKK